MNIIIRMVIGAACGYAAAVLASKVARANIANNIVTPEAKAKEAE